MRIRSIRRLPRVAAAVAVVVFVVRVAQAGEPGEPGRSKLSFFSRTLKKTTSGVKGLVKKPLSEIKNITEKNSASDDYAAESFGKHIDPEDAQNRMSADAFDGSRRYRSRTHRASSQPRRTASHKKSRHAANAQPEVDDSVFSARADDQDSQVNGSNPDLSDGRYMKTQLDTALARLKTRADDEAEKLQEFRAKLQEMRDMVKEYEARHESTVKRVYRMETVIRAVRADGTLDYGQLPTGVAASIDPATRAPQTNPDSWAAEGYKNPQETETQKDSSYESIAKQLRLPARGVTRQPNGAMTSRLQTAPAKKDFTGIAPPPMGLGDAPIAMARSRSVREEISPMAGPGPELSRKNNFARAGSVPRSIILSIQGRGKDAQIRIGIGKNRGIKTGDIFESRDASGKKSYFVVIESAQTSATAIPHPNYEPGNFSKQDLIWLRQSPLPNGQ